MSSKLMPWACWGEWADVAVCLNGTNSQGTGAANSRELQALGVDMVAAWRSRGRVPLAADITAALVEARLQDEQLVGHPGSKQQPFHEAASDHALRLAYSLPIVRLVNGIADSQQRGRVAASVAVLTRTAGLPHLLVDIRHNATHGELPSLVMLRLGCKQALDWLQAAYWDAQAQQLQGNYTRINHILASLLASCTAAATKAAAPGPDACDDVGGSGSSSEEEYQPGSVCQGAGGPDVGQPWRPGLEQLLPGLRLVHGPTFASNPSLTLHSSMDGCSYNAAQGRKERQELLSQLKALVPQGWAHVLVCPLLDSSALPPPLAVHSAAVAAAAAAGGGSFLPGHPSMEPGRCTSEQAQEGRAWVHGDGGWVSEDVLAVLEGKVKLAAWAAQQAGTTGFVQAVREEEEAQAAALAVAQKAWLACMSLLLKAYPALGSMLLHGSVYRLCHAQTSPSTTDELSQHKGHHPFEGPCSRGGVYDRSSSGCDAWCGGHGPLNAAPTMGLRGPGSVVEGDGSKDGFHPLPNGVRRLLVLYSWATQLLGPAAQEPGSMKAGKQGHGKAEQQQGAATSAMDPRLPTIHSSLLSQHQLIQLLSDLLQDSHSSSKQGCGAGRGCRHPGSSAALQECRRRLAGRLASDLRQHILQAEVLAGQNTGMQRSEGWKGSNSTENVVERGIGGKECNRLPLDWLQKAQVLVELAQRLPQQPGVQAPATASLHVTGGAAQPLPRMLLHEHTPQQVCQPRFAEILQPPPYPPSSDSKPATEDTALAVAEVQQAELLRHMRSARGGHRFSGAEVAAAQTAANLAPSTRNGVLPGQGPGAHVGCNSKAFLQRQGRATACTDAQGPQMPQTQRCPRTTGAYESISIKRPHDGGSTCTADPAASTAQGGRAQEDKRWDGPPRHKRWRVVVRWQPCAIGCLPNALQIGGRLPSLAGQAPFGTASMPGAACGAAGADGEEQQQQQQQQQPHLIGPNEQQPPLQEEEWGKMNSNRNSLNGIGRETGMEEKARQAASMECKGAETSQEDEGKKEEEKEEQVKEDEGKAADGHWQHDPGAWQHMRTNQGLFLQAQAGVMYL